MGLCVFWFLHLKGEIWYIYIYTVYSILTITLFFKVSTVLALLVVITSWKVHFSTPNPILIIVKAHEKLQVLYMFGGFLKWGVPFKSFISIGIFHYKPSSYWDPLFMEPPYNGIIMDIYTNHLWNMYHHLWIIYPLVSWFYGDLMGFDVWSTIHPIKSN